MFKNSKIIVISILTIFAGSLTSLLVSCNKKSEFSSEKEIIILDDFNNSDIEIEFEKSEPCQTNFPTIHDHDEYLDYFDTHFDDYFDDPEDGITYPDEIFDFYID